MSEEGETTTISAATSKSKSLRATIPAGIVRQFQLSEKDKLRWKIEAKGDERVIIVKPIKNTKKKTM